MEAKNEDWLEREVRLEYEAAEREPFGLGAAPRAVENADAEILRWLSEAAVTVHCNYVSGPECFTVTVHDSEGGAVWNECYHGRSVRVAAMRARAAVRLPFDSPVRLAARAYATQQAPGEATEASTLDAIRKVLGIEHDVDGTEVWYVPAEPNPVECATLEEALREFVRMVDAELAPAEATEPDPTARTS